MATRLEKSRKIKRTMAKGSYNSTTGAAGYAAAPGRKPKLDKKGYPTYGGIPYPTLVDFVTVTTATAGTLPQQATFAATDPNDKTLALALMGIVDPGDGTVDQVRDYLHQLEECLYFDMGRLELEGKE